MKRNTCRSILFTLSIVALLSSQFYQASTNGVEIDAPAIGNPKVLEQGYAKWKQLLARKGLDRKLTLNLGYAKGLSTQFSRAKGTLTMDLKDGTVSVRVYGLPEDRQFDIWLVDNRPTPSLSVKPEPGDGLFRLGRLRTRGDTQLLEAKLAAGTVKDFKLDMVVVADVVGSAIDSGWLYGSPSLFQRLYYAEGRGLGDTAAQEPTSFAALAQAPFKLLIPAPAYAADPPNLAALVAAGEHLFFNETFGGNGRTCGTCHPAENNFTIDPKFIARLARQRPRDPLFVAEFNPDLRDLEKPELMRKFGLILENVDGFDRPGVMRGVPHTLALLTSLGTPEERTGWSGDGSPGGGDLLSFATGAVTQHFTKTLNRVKDVDFRLPTDDELVALEAFQLSLGRQEDPDLVTLVLRDPQAEGKVIFLKGTNPTGDPALGGRCSACHSNAGALTASGVNLNVNTGVEDLPDLASGIPRDGGFGPDPNPNGGFGTGAFNTPSLVEAADTGPFFHNNAVETIEQSIEFFNSESFNTPARLDAGGGIQMEPEQVEAVAAFLRVINAVENGRSATASATVAMSVNELNIAKRPLTLGIKDIADAIKVLTAKQLEPDAVDDLRHARRLLDRARQTNRQGPRNALIQSAIQSLVDAKAIMVVSE